MGKVILKAAGMLVVGVMCIISIGLFILSKRDQTVSAEEKDKQFGILSSLIDVMGGEYNNEEYGYLSQTGTQWKYDSPSNYWCGKVCKTSRGETNMWGCQCMGYANAVWQAVFGHWCGSVTNEAKYYFDVTTDSTQTVVACDKLTGGAKAYTLLRTADSGDFIQACTTSDTPHSMIILTITPDSITVLDCNSGQDMYIRQRKMTWTEFADNFIAFTVYRSTCNEN